MFNRRMVPISLYYSMVFMSGGAFSAYIGLYLAHIHMGNFEVGLLTSVGALIALIGQPFWGIKSDRAKYKNRILLICLIVSTGTIWLIPAAGSELTLLLPFFAIFYFFQCAINPLSDAITLELASAGNFSFSMIRTIGSLGFALVSGAAGWLFDKNISYIFISFSIFMFLSMLLSLFIPAVEGHQSGVKKVSLSVIFKDKQLVCIYVFALIIEATLGFFFAFNSIYSQQIGISTHLIGLGVMVGSFSQFPFMIFFDRLYRKFGIVKILIFSGVVHAVRWLLYATLLSSKTIILLWLLHGGTYVLFYLCLAEYINQNVVKELKASGQMMNSIITMGLSKIIGGLLGGLCASLFGIRLTFAFSAVVCFVTIAAFLAVVKFSSLFKNDDLKRNKEDYSPKTVGRY
jgi:PPP family 3-phenylpropionic acid transporter